MTLIDDLLVDRAETVLRFRSALHHRGHGHDPRLTPARRRILRQMLQAIDGREAGATYRQIARAVLRAPPVSSTVWKTMSERDAVLRRVRDGLKLVNGDYRKLLRHHPPR